MNETARITLAIFLTILPAAAATTACGGGDDSPPGDGPDGGGEPGTCEEVQGETLGTHIVAEVTWPATTGINAGSGVVHIWSRAQVTYDGDQIDGTVHACGSLVPPLEASAIAGGGMIQPVFPDAVWDAEEMPEFTVTGTQGGFDPGSAIHLEPVATVIGATMDDPENGAWPATGADMETLDHDGNGEPGIDAVPRSDDPFRLPPVDLLGALDPNGPRADVLYLAIRTVLELEGVREGCDAASGTATLHHFDNHVVGCHLASGAECDEDQAGFVDDNRTVFQVGSATFTMAHLPEGASCADVRAALPE